MIKDLKYGTPSPEEMYSAILAAQKIFGKWDTVYFIRIIKEEINGEFGDNDEMWEAIGMHGFRANIPRTSVL